MLTVRTTGLMKANSHPSRSSASGSASRALSGREVSTVRFSRRGSDRVKINPAATRKVRALA